MDGGRSELFPEAASELGALSTASRWVSPGGGVESQLMSGAPASSADLRFLARLVSTLEKKRSDANEQRLSTYWSPARHEKVFPSLSEGRPSTQAGL